MWKQVSSCYAEIMGVFIFLLPNHISKSIKIPVFFSFFTALVFQNMLLLFLSISINYWDTTGFVCFFPLGQQYI